METLPRERMACKRKIGLHGKRKSIQKKTEEVGMNICLIGMPSSGKSVLGRMLARKRKMSFLDLDTLIQKNSGKLLREIIAEEGREGFLRIEEETGASLFVENTVIAPGGSICYGERAMRHLQKIAKVIFLHLPYEEMEKRIGDPVKRGVAIPEGFTLKDLYEERTALYQKYAEYTLEEGNRTAEECLLELMRYLDSV